MPRCADCDIETLFDGNDFHCPLCDGNNVVSYYQRQWVDMTNYSELRDNMAECATLLIEAVARHPQIANLITPVYQWVNERAEEYDTKANTL